VSQKWPDVSFRDLRAQGGFRLSAVRKGGRTVHVTVTSSVDAPLRLKNPFGDRQFTSSLPHDVVGDELRCALRAGQTIELHASN